VARKPTIPKCLAGTPKDSFSAINSAGEAWVLSLNDDTRMILRRLRSDTSVVGCWAKLHALCEDDLTFEREAEQLVLTLLFASYDVRRDNGKSAKERAAQMGRIAALSARLSNEITGSEHRGFPTGALFVGRDRKNTLGQFRQALGANDSRALWQILRANLPPLANTLTRLQRLARKEQRRIASLPAEKVSREGHRDTKLLKAMCSYLVERFPNAPRRSISALVAAMTASTSGRADADFHKAAEVWLSKRFPK
jgi:hypothetical protein